jgi:Na+-driven multidrug efflux pump
LPLVAPCNSLPSASTSKGRTPGSGWVADPGFIAVALTYTGGLQGTGDTRSPLYISIVSQVLVPLGICYAIQQTGTLQPLHIWIAILVGHATRCALSVARFNQGKWREITV